MKKTKIFLSLFILCLFIFPGFALAQNDTEGVNGGQNIPADAYYKAEVVQIVSQDYQGTGIDKQVFQNLEVKILDGDEKNKLVEIDNVGGTTVNGGRNFKVGDTVVINKTTDNGETAYYVNDIYRIPALVIVTILFFALVMVFSRWRGVTSILGLGLSILVIVKFVAPEILAGKNPLAVSLIGIAVIAVISLYLAHGFNKRTSIALLGTAITLVLAVVVSLLFVHFTALFGNGSDESVYLQFNQTTRINLQGLLLGGIMLGVLGVLDDITTAQSATVDELKKANPNLTFKELYTGAASVGREHISSLINTLFLAYAGVSLPLFLLLSTNGGAPIWTTLNSEFIAEEIVRTVIGSMTLVVAVPITTLLAAYFFTKTGPSKAQGHSHIH